MSTTLDDLQDALGEFAPKPGEGFSINVVRLLADEVRRWRACQCCPNCEVEPLPTSEGGV